MVYMELHARGRTVILWEIHSTVIMFRYMNESDPRSDVHYLSSSENKAWKKFQACTGFEPMTSAIPVQRSTNWANKLGYDVGSK